MSEVSLRSRLIGAWQLVNFVVRDATNAEERSWSERPLGPHQSTKLTRAVAVKSALCHLRTSTV